MELKQKIEVFATLLKSEQIRGLKENNVACQANIDGCKVSIKPGKKYIKVDVNNSGKYMVEKSTEIIYGIKGYGQIHRGHQYGTLDTIQQWDWSRYTAFQK